MDISQERATGQMYLKTNVNWENINVGGWESINHRGWESINVSFLTNCVEARKSLSLPDN